MPAEKFTKQDAEQLQRLQAKKAAYELEAMTPIKTLVYQRMPAFSMDTADVITARLIENADEFMVALEPFAQLTKAVPIDPPMPDTPKEPKEPKDPQPTPNP